jgi:hypothetical protein
MKSCIFWDITPCNPFKVNRRSEGTCRLHLQGQKIRQDPPAGFLLGLFFDPEDGGDMFLRNVPVDIQWTIRRCILVDRTLHKNLVLKTVFHNLHNQMLKNRKIFHRHAFYYEEFAI